MRQLRGASSYRRPLIPPQVCTEYLFLLVSVSCVFGNDLLRASEVGLLFSHSDSEGVVGLCTGFLYLIAAVRSIFLRIVGGPQAGVGWEIEMSYLVCCD